MPSLAGYAETNGIARTTGWVHLCLAGATNVATGAALTGLAVSGRLLAAVVDGVEYVSPATALRYGNLLATLATDAAFAAGLALVVLGVAACVGGYAARRGRPTRRVFALAICTGVNPLALPVAFVAVALLAVSREPLPEEEDAAGVAADDDYGAESTGGS